MKNYLELSDLFGEKSLNERMMDLSVRLRAYRKKQGLTQADLADRSGVSYGSVKRFERTGEISLESLWKLAIALGCDDQMDRLFSKLPLTVEDVRYG